MYTTDEAILEKLGAANAPEQEQALLLEKAHTLIGEAISETLTDQQLAEYEAITKDDQNVIAAWLAEHVPAYKSHPLYDQLQKDVADDADKLFASIAWTELNVPKRQEIVDSVVNTL